MRIHLEFDRWRVNCPDCKGVHVEHLDWLAENPRYTKRFARHVGALCREMSNKAVADLERLHDSTVKDLDKLYMREQVERAGTPAPRAIGVDEISIRKGHNYRIVVSDLERGRPIWIGGEGRKEVDMDCFFAALGPKKSAKIELAVMDMRRPFRSSLARNAPAAKVVFDKFHIIRPTHSTRSGEVSTGDSAERSGATSRERAICCFPIRRISRSTVDTRCRSCWRPTSASTRPICSRNPLASCGATVPNAVRAHSSSDGRTRSSGSGCRPIGSLPR